MIPQSRLRRKNIDWPPGTIEITVNENITINDWLLLK